MTDTLNVQLSPAPRDPPVKDMVLVKALLARLLVPLHADEVESITERPSGNTSVKEMFVRGTLPLAVLFMVKVNVEGLPLMIGSGEKDFVRDGAGAGIRQPENLTLSMAKRALLFCAPVAEIRK
jgi:hypothetical protein